MALSSCLSYVCFLRPHLHLFGWGGGNGEKVKGEGSTVFSLFRVVCCFRYLEPQQSSIVSFIACRGRLLHPLVGEFVLRCGRKYLVRTKL